MKRRWERLDKIISMIGMATKAGRTASGEFMTERAVKKGDAFLGGGCIGEYKEDV